MTSHYLVLSLNLMIRLSAPDDQSPYQLNDWMLLGNRSQ